MAGFKILLHSRTAEIEKPIAEAEILGNIMAFAKLEGQRVRPGQDLELMNVDFDLARGQIGIDRAFEAMIDDALHSYDVLGADGLGQAVGLGMGLRVENQLGDALSVAEIDENDTSVVAIGISPASQSDRRADIGGSEFAAVMAADIERIGGRFGQNCCHADDSFGTNGLATKKALYSRTTSSKGRPGGGAKIKFELPMG